MEKPYTLHLGDCLEVLRTLPDNSVDSIVTDPPYGLSKEPDMAEVLRHWLAGDDYTHKGGGFMGKSWDSFVPGPSVWKECLRVLKPGGHLLAFFGTRTQDMGTLAIRLAGFEIRDSIAWVYGSGFPKSRDIGKDIDYRGGANLTWFGPWLREWREKRGIGQSELAKHFPSKSGGKTGRVSNFELGVRLPTADDFNLICKVLDLPFSSIEEAEREVIGKKAGDPMRFKAFAEQDGNERRTFNNDLTAPATDAARQWQGWGTALKPALEPITVARKPLIGTVAANVLAHGTGALNIDGCRVGTETRTNASKPRADRNGFVDGFVGGTESQQHDHGRWPANLIHDGSDEVVVLFPNAPGQQGRSSDSQSTRANTYGELSDNGKEYQPRGDSGSAARFFYCAKASRKDRHEGLDDPGAQFKRGTTLRKVENTTTTGNNHPTVKPTDLMAYLCRLVTPPGGVVLDPYMGSGSTGKAAIREGFRFIGCERDQDSDGNSLGYMAIAKARIEHELAKRQAADDLAVAVLAVPEQVDLFAAVAE